jgi:hypothetical protein
MPAAPARYPFLKRCDKAEIMEAISIKICTWKRFPSRTSLSQTSYLKLVATSNSFHRRVKTKKILHAKAKDFGCPYGAPDPIVEGGPKYDAAMKGSL